MSKVGKLTARIRDNRSRRVVFLAHCILNENTRYLGGACRGCCVKEIVDRCIDGNIGMVQMPCPEQRAWGGVLKKRLLWFYGTKGTLSYRLRGVLLPLLTLYTRLIYRRMAREIASEVQAYLTSGFSVVGIVGVDGSPSCGVNKTLDLRRSLDAVASFDLRSVTARDANHMVSDCLVDGSGIFTGQLQEQLRRKHENIPFLAHDLIGEIEGKQSSVVFR